MKTEYYRIDAFKLCWRSLFQSPLDCKEIKPVNPKEKSVLNIHWKDLCWSWNSCTSYWCKELTHWKRPWCWKRLKAGGEGDNRGWDGWMASLTWWTWVWISSRSCRWTGKPGVLQFMGLHRVRHDWVTELTEPHTHTHTHTHIEIYHRNWLLLIWRLRSPTICRPQAGEEKLLV